MATKNWQEKYFLKNGQMPLQIPSSPNSTEIIVLHCFQNNCISAFFAFKMAATNDGRIIFLEKHADDVAHTLLVKNLVTIALFHTISEINAF